MKLSKRVHKVNSVVFVTALLLLSGLASAQNPKVWGRAVDGLQMRIYPAESGQSKVAKFRVELRNVGEKDLLLNLGIMTRNGGQQYPTAISLILVDSKRLFQDQIVLQRSLPVSDTGKETLYLPLSVGATFSFPADLDDYWAVNSKESDYKLNAGTYWLAAHLAGFIADDRKFFTGGLGQPPRLVRTFDMVNPESGLGPPPMSNTLQF